MSNTTGAAMSYQDTATMFRAMERLPRPVRLALWEAAGNWDPAEIWVMFCDARKFDGLAYATAWTLRRIQQEEDVELKAFAARYQRHYHLPLPAFAAGTSRVRYGIAA
ncbi:hypothetical protein UFOVP99_39 [uncultured Caudovirales phage]|uniref:Uncharacterized protein n=1 Tax=uncultured Caudovirales phage TaxID=2100421 RepID=A0A6J5L5D9_9CAUD|nr:hypothetical protein UFOVP99_39 [uncultured Caudovirales phage]